jgi:hypothetical protein
VIRAEQPTPEPEIRKARTHLATAEIYIDKNRFGLAACALHAAAGHLNRASDMQLDLDLAASTRKDES